MITLQKYDNENDELINFLTREKWRFHSVESPQPEKIETQLKEGFYSSPEVQTFWILDDQTRIGFIRLFDLEDDTPLFDIRIGSSSRGKGAGAAALKLLCHYVFDELGKQRLEGYTRADNVPMIQLFKKCGFAKEAHHRQAWPDSAGNYHDTAGFSILRSDWESNTISPVLF